MNKLFFSENINCLFQKNKNYHIIYFFLIFIIAALVLIWNLGMIPLLGSEGRWALICRHMYRYGDIFHPFLGDSLYWDKPLLSYWLVLPFAYINGGVTEAMIRIPSVICALLLLYFTFDIARTWFGTRTAFLSTAVLMTSYGFVFWARNAQVEMLNAFVIFISIWYFLKHKSNANHSWVYILGIIMAIGANMKGLTAYGVPIFSIITLLIVKKEWPAALTLRHCIAAVILSLAVYLAFPLADAYFTKSWDPLQLVWHENVIRFFKPFDHKGPVWTYFVRIFDLAAPWSLLLPVALIRLIPKFKEQNSSVKEMLALFCGVFIFFTLSGSRRSYYLLPILPFASIISAHLLTGFSESSLSPFSDRFIKGFGYILGFILIVPLAVLVFYPGLYPVSGMKLWVVTILLFSVSPFIIYSSKKRHTGKIAGAMVAITFIYIFGIIPVFSQLPNIRSQVEEVKSFSKACAFFPKKSDPVLYYMDRPCRVFSDENTAYAWAVANNGIVFIPDKAKVPKERWQAVVNLRKWNAMKALYK